MARGATLLVAAIAVLALGGIAFLYAYRAQDRPTPEVPVSTALQDVEDGRVLRVSIEGQRATLTLRDGTRRITTLPPGPEDVLITAVTEHNRANPEEPIEIQYEQRTGVLGGTAFAVLLSLLPVLLLGVLILPAARTLVRGGLGRRYELLARLADLRDRGALTEDEFQREKARLLG